MTDWDRRFLERADEIARWSKDLRTGVGAVAVRDKRAICDGYNGFPPGIHDDPALLGRDLTPEQRERKRKMITHAEAALIANAARMGVSLAGATLFVSKPPCADCAKLIIGAGIARVVTRPIVAASSWADSQMAALDMFALALVAVSLRPKDAAGLNFGNSGEFGARGDT